LPKISVRVNRLSDGAHHRSHPGAAQVWPTGYLGDMTPSDDRRETFRRLHQSGCFVIPNPWDLGSARLLARLGFPALATTSAGFAFAQGLPDSVTALPRELVVRHVAEIVRATELPVNADFQSGYAVRPEGIAESVQLCV